MSQLLIYPVLTAKLGLLERSFVTSYCAERSRWNKDVEAVIALLPCLVLLLLINYAFPFAILVGPRAAEASYEPSSVGSC